MKVKGCLDIAWETVKAGVLKDSKQEIAQGIERSGNSKMSTESWKLQGVCKEKSHDHVG